MLTPKELKIVVDTLALRRAWLRKALEDTALTDEIRHNHSGQVQCLDSAIEKLNLSPAKNKPSVAARVVKPTLRTARLLVAEDSSVSAQLMIDMLQDMGFKLIDHAQDGIDAFDKIKAAPAPYDLILCDWRMPGISGLEVHSKAKASNTLRGAHFIMVTAVSDVAQIKLAAQQGIDDYVVKPIDADVLETKINAALGLVIGENTEQ